MHSDRFVIFYGPNSLASSAAAITARTIAAVTARRTATVPMSRMLYRWGHSSGRIRASPGTPSGAE